MTPTTSKKMVVAGAAASVIGLAMIANGLKVAGDSQLAYSQALRSQQEERFLTTNIVASKVELERAIAALRRDDFYAARKIMGDTGRRLEANISVETKANLPLITSGNTRIGMGIMALFGGAVTIFVARNESKQRRTIETQPA